jgi:hypothetical protein
MLRRPRHQLYVTRFSHARKSKSQAREMDHMDYQNYAVAEDRIQRGTRGTLNPTVSVMRVVTVHSETKVYGRVTSTRSDYKLKSKI